MPETHPHTWEAARWIPEVIRAIREGDTARTEYLNENAPICTLPDVSENETEPCPF